MSTQVLLLRSRKDESWTDQKGNRGKSVASTRVTDECAFGIDFNSLFGILLLNWALKPRTLKVT